MIVVDFQDRIVPSDELLHETVVRPLLNKTSDFLQQAVQKKEMSHYQRQLGRQMRNVFSPMKLIQRRGSGSASASTHCQPTGSELVIQRMEQVGDTTRKRPELLLARVDLLDGRPDESEDRKGGGQIRDGGEV